MKMKTLILGFISLQYSKAFPALSKQINHERKLTTKNCTLTVKATEDNLIFKSFQNGNLNTYKGYAGSMNTIGRIVDVAIKMRDDDNKIFLDISRQNPLDHTEYAERKEITLDNDCKILNSDIYVSNTYKDGIPT